MIHNTKTSNLVQVSQTYFSKAKKLESISAASELRASNRDERFSMAPSICFGIPNLLIVASMRLRQFIKGYWQENR